MNNRLKIIIENEKKAIEPMVTFIHGVNIGTNNADKSAKDIRSIAKQLVKDQFTARYVSGEVLREKEKEIRDTAKAVIGKTKEEVVAFQLKKYKDAVSNYVSRRILNAQGLLSPSPVVDDKSIDMAVVKQKLNAVLNDFTKDSEYIDLNSTTEGDDDLLLTVSEARNYASLNCAKPVKTKLPNGRTIWNRCGKCVACLASRRLEWSRRLVDEKEHPQCLHAFGFTLTYDNEHIPYLSLEELVKGEYDWEAPNSTHTYLNVRRGCSPESMKLQDNIGLLNNRDIDLYIKKVRKKCENTYYELIPCPNGKYKNKTKRKPYIFVRFFIVGEYGAVDDLNKVDLAHARTGRPHYHGIFYVFADTEERANRIKNNGPFLKDIQVNVEKWALDCWEHCQQKWDNRKQIYVGKSIQAFGQGWGNYLGKYLNKNVLAGFKGCIGSLFVPEKTWCSRRNPTIGLGSIGLSTFFYNKTLMNKFLQELDQCVKSGERWNPTYVENDYEKALPRSYRRYLLEHYFGISMSKVAKYIFANNIVKKQCNKGKDVRSTTEFVDEDLVNFIPNYNELYSKIQAYTYDGLGNEGIDYHRIILRFRKYSIATAPVYTPDEYPVVESVQLPLFDQEDISRILRFISFRDSQTNLYLDSLCNWEIDEDGNQFTLDDKRAVIKLEGVKTRTCPILSLSYLSKSAVKHRVKSFQTSEHVELVRKRLERVDAIKRATEKALSYKFNHELKNGYTKVNYDGTIVVKD